MNISGHPGHEPEIGWRNGWKLVVAISYTDANGSQALETRVHIRRYQTTGLFLESVSVYGQGKDNPFIASGPAYRP